MSKNQQSGTTKSPPASGPCPELRAIIRNGSWGQLLVLFGIGTVIIGGLVLLGSLVLDGGGNAGPVVFLLIFICVFVVGIHAMGRHLMQTPVAEVRLDDEPPVDPPLGPSLEALAPPIQALVRGARDARDKIRTRAESAIDVLDIVTPWLVQLELLEDGDRAMLEERGVVLADLEHEVHHFDPERAPLDAQALLRSVDERILGYVADDPMRREGSS